MAAAWMVNKRCRRGLRGQRGARRHVANLSRLPQERKQAAGSCCANQSASLQQSVLLQVQASKPAHSLVLAAATLPAAHQTRRSRRLRCTDIASQGPRHSSSARQRDATASWPM